MGRQISLRAADGHELAGYAAGGGDAAKALVVVQEIFGVNHHMRAVCDHFAERGYAVICPALFDRAERGVELGYADADRDRGMQLRAAVPEAGTLADVEAAARALGDRPVGIVGYCWGGTIAWWGATRSGLFGTAIGWYGGGIAKARDETPRCPVQLHFGEADRSIPTADIAAIRAAQPGIEVYTYENAGHGFGCDERATYDATATALAERRTLDFLAAHL